MKTSLLACLAAVCPVLFAAPPTEQELRQGVSYLPTQVYSLEDDTALLKVFEGLRVADVSDGMDAVGLHNTGLMDPSIHPLWKDPKNYAHRFIGVAITARYVRTQNATAGKQSIEAYDKWAGSWYNEKSSEPFMALIRAGTAVVIEDSESADVGSIGSNNIMQWKIKGAVGVVTSATARDTDEIETQRVPLYLKQVGRGIRPGRNEIESVNRPVTVGGVLVRPGDIIVADGDGVIVVPRAVAKEVAAYAHKILDGDKAGRRDLYKQLGLPDDASVR
ncbi:MAG: RraA family protein [Opitutaceae bacterium]|nr:RraA family protein [Opitutaceae bacterium]